MRVAVFLLKRLQLLLALRAPVALRPAGEVGVRAVAVEQHELLLGLGAERLQLLGPVDDPLHDVHARVRAGVAGADELGERVGDPAELLQMRGELAVVVARQVERAQVAVLVDQLARLAQLGQAEAAAQCTVKRGAAGRQQLVLEGLVGGVEREAAGEAVDDVEQRVDPGLDRPLAQQRGGEAVDRLDVAAIQIARRCEHPLALLALRHSGPALKRVPDARRQLGRRLLGERDHHQLVHGRRARREHVRDPLDQHGRLARARPRLDAEVGGEVAGDPLAGGLVGEPFGHWTALIWVASRASRSSPSLAAA